MQLACGMNLTKDFWNEVLQERHSPTQVFRINNLIADVNSLQDVAKTTDEKLFSGCSEGRPPYVMRDNVFPG